MSQELPSTESKVLSSDDVPKKFKVPEFLQHGRRNPINGKSCFFTESSFRKVVGPEPSFHDKLTLQIMRAKNKPKSAEERKDRRKDPDLPSDTLTDKKTDVSEASVKIVKPNLNPKHNSDLTEVQSDKDTSEDDDDDESVAGLVIVDSREPMAKVETEGCEVFVEHKNNDCQLKTETHESTTSINSHSVTNGVLPNSLQKQTSLTSNETVSLEKSEPPAVLPSYAVGIVPLNATGIASHTGLSTDTPPDAGSKLKLTEEGSDATEPILPNQNMQQSPQKSQPEEKDMCLVMPPETSDDDDNESGPSKFSGSTPTSSLPLIPALMSDSLSAGRADATQNSAGEKALTEPNVATLFYKADQTPTSPASKQSTELRIHPCNKPNITGPAQEGMDTDSGTELPIFSMVADSSGAEKEEGSLKRSSLRNKGIWSEELLKAQNPQHQKKALVEKDDTVKEAMKFHQSNLTREEMALYLHLYGKYVAPYLRGGHQPNLLTQQQTKEMAEFESLQEKVRAEQREFQAYLQQNALRNPHYYNFISPDARFYASTKAQSYRPHNKMIKLFSDGFSKKIPLQQQSLRADLIFQRIVLELGSAPKIVLPEIKSGNNSVPVTHDMKKLEQNFPRSQRNRAPGILHHESASKDVNAQALAMKYAADVVLSSSVVKCLMNNRRPGYTRPWNIPLTVRLHKTENGVQKVVYLNKPLFGGHPPMREYNALYHKYAFRVMASHPKHAPTPSRGQKQGLGIGKMESTVRAGGGGRKTRASEDPFDMPETDLDSLETFGKATAAASTKASPSVSKAKTNGSNVASPSLRSKRELEAGPSGKPSEERVEPPESQEPSTLKASTGSVVNTSSIGIHLTPSKSPQDLTEDVVPEPSRRTSLRKRPLTSPLSPDSTGAAPVGGEVTVPSPNKELPHEKTKDAGCTPDQVLLSQSQVPESEKSLLMPRSRRQRKVVSLTPQVMPQRTRLSIGGDGGRSGEGSNLLDLILGPDRDTGVKKEMAPQENPNEYLPHSEELSSIVYSMWNLNTTKVLIRTRSQGILRAKNVYITSKMEYQTSHGYEQVTAEEMIRDWTACFIRPNTKLLRARINAFNSNIMMYEELEPPQILHSSTSFRPEEGFSFMDHLFKHLSDLESGEYLLSHESGADHCGLRVLKKGADPEAMEPVVAAPIGKRPDLASVPWIPIDPNLLMPYHVINQRIPATFLPKDVVVPKPGTKRPPPDRNAAAQEKKNKKKKKNKNKNRFQKKNKETQFF